MNHLNQRGTTRRAMLRAGAAAGTAAALGAVGLFAAETTSADIATPHSADRLPYPTRRHGHLALYSRGRQHLARIFHR